MTDETLRPFSTSNCSIFLLVPFTCNILYYFRNSMHHRLALNLIGSLDWDQISSPPLLSRGVLGLQVNAITLVRDQEILLFIFSSVLVIESRACTCYSSTLSWSHMPSSFPLLNRWNSKTGARWVPFWNTYSGQLEFMFPPWVALLIWAGTNVVFSHLVCRAWTFQTDWCSCTCMDTGT